jgi:hypothetical protein
MRLALFSVPALAAVLAGCAAFAPEPDLANLPHATVAGTHVEVDGERVDTFRAIEIDGRRVLPDTDQPAKLIGVDSSDLLPAGASVHVEIEGLAIYRSSVRRLFWDPMTVHGRVDFVPQAGAHYSLHGSITPERSSVWIEDDATHEVVGNRLSAIGRSAPTPADAASDVSTRMRPGGA